jgi:hypothetical protein
LQGFAPHRSLRSSEPLNMTLFHFVCAFRPNVSSIPAALRAQLKAQGERDGSRGRLRLKGCSRSNIPEELLSFPRWGEEFDCLDPHLLLLAGLLCGSLGECSVFPADLTLRPAPPGCCHELFRLISLPRPLGKPLACRWLGKPIQK